MNQFLLSTMDVPKLIKKYIEEFEKSPERTMMREGNKYYVSDNTEILNRRMLMYGQLEDPNNTDIKVPVLMDDPYKANNKLASGHYKTIVDQKLEYVLGNIPSIQVEGKNLEKQINDTLSKKFDENLKKAAKDSCKQSVGWLQVYIDANGKFRTMRIKPEQFVPVYNADDDSVLETGIRYYKVVAVTKEGNVINVNRAEVWDTEKVTYYQQETENGDYVLCSPEIFEVNPMYHFDKVTKYGETSKEVVGQSWGAVPFIPIYNNDERLYDLKPIKRFIDAYDLVKSDFVNNLEDFQDIVWILKGYSGQSVNTFLEDVKKFKAINVEPNPDGGDARPETIDVPYEARKEALAGLRNDIYDFGQGFDPDEATGATATATFIEALYIKLSLKGKAFISEINAFFDRLLYFLNRYWELQNIPQIDPETIKINYKLTLINNESEALTTNAGQQGSVSEKTRLAHHPWVDDVEAEIKLMKEEIPDVVIPEDEDEDDPEGDE